MELCHGYPNDGNFEAPKAAVRSRFRTGSLLYGKTRSLGDWHVYTITNPVRGLGALSELFIDGELEATAVSYTHLTLPTTPYV